MADGTSTEIEAAFRKLKILPPNEWRLNSIVQTLAFIPLGASGKSPRKFRAIGKKAARKELDDVAKTASKLKGLLDDLSQTSILALADAGLLQVVHHIDISNRLGSLEVFAKKADVSGVPEKQGKGQPQNNLVSGVANMIAHNYFTLTGRKPTVSTKNNGVQDIAYGPFFVLVGDIFRAMKIDASPEAAAREAVKAFKERK